MLSALELPIYLPSIVDEQFASVDMLYKKNRLSHVQSLLFQITRELSSNTNTNTNTNTIINTITNTNTIRAQQHLNQLHTTEPSPCASRALGGFPSANTSSTSASSTAATVARASAARLHLRRWSTTFARIAGGGCDEVLRGTYLRLFMPLDGI
ncbi:hypothetical protein V494_02696 [Pseudogymnoascus sp. VKM F-4513 (FW-928)]|nr:hypothetical protein V494_02696 [Pseudogymnoascus sp. VKM F-4513 (FW-928)]